MTSVAEPLEDRIRECAYHMWEASGRPAGRDQEFWYRARETVAGVARRQPVRKRSRKASLVPVAPLAPPG